jgi:hypothetical protein
MSLKIEDYSLVGDTHTAANALVLRSDVQTKVRGFSTVADFTIAAGERKSLVLTWYPSASTAAGYSLELDFRRSFFAVKLQNSRSHAPSETAFRRPRTSVDF